jgi:hypothetical protein
MFGYERTTIKGDLDKLIQYRNNYFSFILKILCLLLLLYYIIKQ